MSPPRIPLGELLVSSPKTPKVDEEVATGELTTIQVLVAIVNTHLHITHITSHSLSLLNKQAKPQKRHQFWGGITLHLLRDCQAARHAESSRTTACPNAQRSSKPG